MLSFTNGAKQELKRILETSVEMPQARLRLCGRGGVELGLGIDIEEAGDKVVTYKGTRILVVNRALASKLSNITLDVDNTPHGPKLVICGDYAS
jgi:Fe-S cluster assembly iron-binding protein IscA